MTTLEICGGIVYDGVSAPHRTNVRIEDGRIGRIGSSGRGKRRLDVSGKFVLPGFIDMHTHSDFTLPARPGAEAKLSQGVTTDVTGNCGFSPFPLRQDAASQRHGAFFDFDGCERWASLNDFAAALEPRQPAINVAPLVGLGAIRLHVVGERDRRATASEMRAMQRLLGDELDSGAFGASSGLVYPPSAYADLNELVAMARVVAAHGGIYATHLRDEGDRVEKAVAEALTVAERSGCPLQISHHKVFGRANWGAVSRTLARIDAARASGDDVTLDAYPYTYGNSMLASLLPAREIDGDESDLQGRLGRPDGRQRMLTALATGAAVDLEDVVLAVVPSAPALAGQTLGDIAVRDGLTAAELLLDLVERDGTKVTALLPGTDEQDLRTVLRHECTMFGSDGWVMNSESVRFAHPRNFAASVRLLAHYVRDEGVLGLREAIRKLTFAPAERLGLRDRGRIAEGAVADIAIVDFEQLCEGSSLEDPCRAATGVTHVLVAGAVAVEDGVVTGHRAGQVLRRSPKR